MDGTALTKYGEMTFYHVVYTSDIGEYLMFKDI
jgi:hypothetical protein